MDNLTHTAVGLFLSRAGLNRWTPSATPILLLAANAPDIDIVTLTGGPLNYLHYHRHLSHSLIAMPVMAAASVLLVRLAGRKPLHWRGAFLAALIGVVSHLLLDWTNIYGVRLLLPFSQEWDRLDLNSIIDLWIWAALLLGLLGPFVARLVGGEITSGAMKEKNPGRGGALFALAFVLFYVGARQVLHTRAVATLESRIYQGIAPARVAALPNEVNPFSWRGLVETADFYAIVDVNLAGEFDPTHATVIPKPDSDPVMDAARRTRTFQELLRFSEFPLWSVETVPEPEGAREVRLLDLRFPRFVASATVDPHLRVLKESFNWNSSRPR